MSDWSSDVCSSDLPAALVAVVGDQARALDRGFGAGLVIVRLIAGHADRAEKLADSVADEDAARRRDASVRENVRKRADECRAFLSHSGKGAADRKSVV